MNTMKLSEKQLKEEGNVTGIVTVIFTAKIQNREEYGLKKQINGYIYEEIISE